MNRAGPGPSRRAVARPPRTKLSTAAALLTLAGCAPAARDVVPESRDVVVDGGGEARTANGYEFVARRPLGVVALAESRGIERNVARAAVDRVADALDRCVAERRQGGALTSGAARVVVQIAAEGEVSAAQLKLDPGLAPGAAEVAVLCLVAPAKSLTFAPSADARRGLAIEALWGELPANP